MGHQHIAKKAGKARHSSSIFSRESSDFFFSPDSEKSKPFFTSNILQPRLKIGATNDKYEQQADQMADTVIRMPDQQVQLQPVEKEEKVQRQAAEQENELQMQPMEEEKELQMKCKECEEHEKMQMKPAIQMQENATEYASAWITKQLNSTKGQGSNLHPDVQREMSGKMGADFSEVIIHIDPASKKMNEDLGAKAFTHGKDIYFNSGQYRPASPRSKHLLAHELTHVLQQSGRSSSPMINMKRKFTAGRPAHDHAPVGWSKIRGQAWKDCDLSSRSGRFECVCASSINPGVVLRAALEGKMFNSPLARKHLKHYMNGGGSEINVDENLENLIKQDLDVRAKFARAISSVHRGHIPIWQGDYSVEDFRLAFGGIDRVDYEVSALKGGFRTVDIWFKDRYDFHPVGFGYANKGTGDILRETNCIHAAAVEQKAYGAADYWMKGEARFPLSLFKSQKVEPHPGRWY